ncbi:MAG: HEAT repeat domain-containing protein, partial [Planctomycetota bacterium]|nr:HEAT repeat domain-containing protein [Planctomycetota bacterium]
MKPCASEQQEPVSDLIKALDGPNRLHALHALGRLKASTALQAVIPHTKDRDGEVRAAAAWALGRMKQGAATEGLVKLCEDSFVPARAAAYWALGALGQSQTRDTLAKGIVDSEREVRLSTVRGIQESGKKEFFKLLVPRLDYQVRMVKNEEKPDELEEEEVWLEPDSAVRAAIIQTLGRLNVIDSTPGMIYALEREESFNRQIIIKTLKQFGARISSVCLGRIVPTPYDKEAFEKRLHLLVNNGTLAVIAGQLGDKRSIPHL